MIHVFQLTTCLIHDPSHENVGVAQVMTHSWLLCPWLIPRFIFFDPQAEFIYVPAKAGLRLLGGRRVLRPGQDQGAIASSSISGRPTICHTLAAARRPSRSI
jgi:hypothetical protein